MKIKEIKELSTEEIKKQIAEDENALVDLRFAHELKQLTNTAKLYETRKTIARLHTVLRERELAEERATSNQSKKGEGTK